MFKTICLALDGSESADKAIPFAAELAEEGGGTIVIAHVIEMVAGKGGIVPIHEEDEIRAQLEERAKQFKDRGIEAAVEIVGSVLGGPAQRIKAIADDAGADLIVVGSRGRSQVAGLMLGSVAQRLLHIAERPVLVVPG